MAIGAGILGLGIGAAIASSNDGYYNRHGAYHNDPYYGGYGYNGYGYNGYANTAIMAVAAIMTAMRRHCTTRRQWDPYYGRWVRVRYC